MFWRPLLRRQIVMKNTKVYSFYCKKLRLNLSTGRLFYWQVCKVLFTWVSACKRMVKALAVTLNKHLVGFSSAGEYWSLPEACLKCQSALPLRSMFVNPKLKLNGTLKASMKLANALYKLILYCLKTMRTRKKDWHGF